MPELPSNHRECRRATSEERFSRELGVFGATMLGLGSIPGTGIFVSIGIAAGVAGPPPEVRILRPDPSPFKQLRDLRIACPESVLPESVQQIAAMLNPAAAARARHYAV